MSFKKQLHLRTSATAIPASAIMAFGLRFNVAFNQVSRLRINGDLTGNKEKITVLNGLGIGANGRGGILGRYNFFH
jgi:hypothetical protein